MKPNQIEIIRESKTNNVIDNRQVHVHLHKHINIKRSSKRIKTSNTMPRICLMCKTMKRMNPGERFCSQNCNFKYSQYKKRKFLEQKSEWENRNKKSWWQLW